MSKWATWSSVIFFALIYAPSWAARYIDEGDFPDGRYAESTNYTIMSVIFTAIAWIAPAVILAKRDNQMWAGLWVMFIFPGLIGFAGCVHILTR